MDYEEKLEEEIEKWKGKLEKEIEQVQPKSEEGSEFMENIRAYYKDSKHFYQKGKLVESFEALVWAWSWLEIGQDYGFLKEDES